MTDEPESSKASSQNDAPKMTQGAVAFLDILGAKGIWKRVEPELLIKRIEYVRNYCKGLFSRVIESGAKYDVEQVGNLKKEHLKIAIISDTLVITFANNNPSVAIQMVAIISSEIIASMLFPEDFDIQTKNNYFRLIVRGAIGFGAYCSGNNIFIGEAIDDVAEWYEQHDLIGAIITPRARYLLNRQIGSSHIREEMARRRLVEYKLPTKNGKLKFICVNWPVWYRDIFHNGNGGFSKDTNELKKNLFNAFSEIGNISPAIDSKYRTTELFFHATLKQAEGKEITPLLEFDSLKAKQHEH